LAYDPFKCSEKTLSINHRCRWTRQVKAGLLISFENREFIYVENQTALLRKLGELEGKVDHHDKQIQGMIDAIRSLVSVNSKPQR
jgi:alpha-glucuronidase